MSKQAIRSLCALIGVAMLAQITNNPAAAAVGPQFKRWEELTAIITNKSIQARLFNYWPVDRIARNADGTYSVSAGRCTLVVAIVHSPLESHIAGDTPITDITIGDVQCR